MEDYIITFAKKYFYFVMMAGGGIIVVGCIYNWEWATRIISPSKFTMIRAFLEEAYGEEARFKFERIVNMLVGLLLIVLGIVYWHFYE